MKEKENYILRQHKLGDMGWIVYRHAIVVAEYYGWGEAFEAVVGEITTDFLKNHHPEKERCWIAEKDGKMLGCVFVVDAGENTSKLRLLYVEPDARGLGVGKRLVEEVVQFSKNTGYDKVLLWTMSNLTAARKIYKQAGFSIILEEPNTEFGENLIAETWELKL